MFRHRGVIFRELVCLTKTLIHHIPGKHIHTFLKNLLINTVKSVLNGTSRDQNIFPLKPGFRLIKVHYIQYKKLNQDMHVFETK